MAKKNLTIGFVCEGQPGCVTGEDSDWVLYGGMGFQRSSASGELKEAIDEAVDGYYTKKTKYTSSELYSKALELNQCAHAWEPNAMLLGNVSAKEMQAVMRDYLNLRLREGIDDENV